MSKRALSLPAETLRRFVLPVVGASGIVCACLGGAADAETPDAAGEIQTVLLEYQEVGYALMSWALDAGAETNVIRNEPANASADASRGVFRFGTLGSLPFLWDRDQARLYLDLDRDGDLTGTAEVFSASPERQFYQVYAKVPLVFAFEGAPHRFLTRLHLGNYGYWEGKGVRPGGYGDVMSYWRGQVVLQGRSLEIGLVKHPVGGHSDFLVLRPWESREQPFDAYGRSLDAWAYTDHLFFGQEACHLSRAPKRDGEITHFELTLRQQQPELGEVQLAGQYLDRVLLRQRGGPSAYTVVLDQPAQVVRIPKGAYEHRQVSVRQGDKRAHTATGIQFVVGDEPVALSMGGPLTNSVSIERRGSTLELGYRLVGAGGEAYRLAQTGERKPPEFSVYLGGREVASGRFEFG